MTGEHELLMSVLKGDEQAVDFCEKVFYISQIWDDWVDGDEVTVKKRYEAFHIAMVQIPRNPFYRQFSIELVALMDAFISDWMDANALQGKDEIGTQIAFVLRESVYSLVIHCAGIIGGLDWKAKVGPEVRRFVFNESYEVFKQELDL